MASHKNQPSQNTHRTATLATLIDGINRQMDQVPHPYAADGFAAFLGSQAQGYKKKGRPHVRFRVEATEFALPLNHVTEIDYLPEITPLPNLPRWVLGICSVRGEIVSVVDLRRVLQWPEGDTDGGRKLILVKNPRMATAIRVDRIRGMLHLQTQQPASDHPMPGDPALARLVARVIVSEGHDVHLLDVDKLMAALAI